jgi:hypothetical protein
LAFGRIISGGRLISFPCERIVIFYQLVEKSTASKGYSKSNFSLYCGFALSACCFIGGIQGGEKPHCGHLTGVPEMVMLTRRTQ